MALKVKQQQPFLRKVREVMAMLDDLRNLVEQLSEIEVPEIE